MKKLFGYISAIALSLALFANHAAAQTLAAPAVPGNLTVPAGNVPYLKLHAIGTQNYICLPSAAGLAWKLFGPQATLSITYRWINGDITQQVATHFLSPNPDEAGTPRATWQSSLDTSAVWAKKIEESIDPQYVAPGAIPWFLLQAVGTEKGPQGGAMLASTTYIQRINTSGGVAPETGCTNTGITQFVPYTADYVFYQPRR